MYILYAKVEKCINRTAKKKYYCVPYRKVLFSIVSFIQSGSLNGGSAVIVVIEYKCLQLRVFEYIHLEHPTIVGPAPGKIWRTLGHRREGRGPTFHDICHFKKV